MPNNGYFDIRRDVEIINAGGFFCEACLVGKPAAEQSPDPRYCQDCYDLLLREAERLPGVKRPVWIPKHQKPKKTGQNQYQVSQQGSRIMSPLESKKIEVDIIDPADATRASVKRGPKHRALPEDLIRQLAGEGMGSKAIVARLKAEHRVKVSYKTIQRVISGERKQLALPIHAT